MNQTYCSNTFIRDLLRDAIQCHKAEGSSTLRTTLFRESDITTIADPFICLHGEWTYLFVEIEGYRSSGSYFKKIGIFKIDLESLTAEYLGESWPEDDGEYSFPFVFRDELYWYMLPDRNEVGKPRSKELCMYKTTSQSFPFGWQKVQLDFPFKDHSSLVNDKIVVRRNNFWWMFVSDPVHGGRLRVYFSKDLFSWKVHPSSPIVFRSQWDRIVNTLIPYSRFPYKPWRLGGCININTSSVLLALQHPYRNRVYGEALSLLQVDGLSDTKISAKLSDSPFFVSPMSGDEWNSQGRHHLHVIEESSRMLFAIDGFDGNSWSCRLFIKNDKLTEVIF